MRTRSVVALAGLLAVIASSGCAGDGEGAKTVTVETEVTVETPPPKRTQKQRNPFPEQTPSTPAAPEFVYCDPNIQARADTTTCPFAQNTFWSYWTSAESSSLQVWSPAEQSAFATTCENDGAEVTCTTSDSGVVKFPKAAVDRYSQTQADAYAGGHDLGPDEGLAPPRSVPDYSAGDGYDSEYDSPTPGANIPNYENGRGYRVECNDGMYSQSGGIQGACSGHGGVAE